MSGRCRFVFRMAVLRSHPWENCNGYQIKGEEPSHEACVVTGEGECTFWTKVDGVGPRDDIKGFNVELIALPVAGRLVICEREETGE